MPALDGFLDVVNLKGHVREFLDDLRQRASFFVTHPLDAEFAGLVAAMIEPELGEVGFAGHGLGRGDAEVVVTQVEFGHNKIEELPKKRIN